MSLDKIQVELDRFLELTDNIPDWSRVLEKTIVMFNDQWNKGHHEFGLWQLRKGVNWCFFRSPLREIPDEIIDQGLGPLREAIEELHSYYAITRGAVDRSRVESVLSIKLEPLVWYGWGDAFVNEVYEPHWTEIPREKAQDLGLHSVPGADRYRLTFSDSGDFTPGYAIIRTDPDFVTIGDTNWRRVYTGINTNAEASLALYIPYYR